MKNLDIVKEFLKDIESSDDWESFYIEVKLENEKPTRRTGKN